MIEHTRDFRRVRRLRPGKADLSSDVYYLIDVENGEDIGIWSFTSGNDCLEIHANMTVRGAAAAKSARAALRWIFENPDHEIVTAIIPAHMRHAQFMACHIGFAFYTAEQGYRHYFCDEIALYDRFLGDRRHLQADITIH